MRERKINRILKKTIRQNLSIQETNSKDEQENKQTLNLPNIRSTTDGIRIPLTKQNIKPNSIQPRKRLQHPVGKIIRLKH